MDDESTTRWTVSVSKKTDIAVRSFLAQRGLKKGNLSKFIEDAVKWRLLDQTVAETRSKFADMPPEELEPVIDEAVAAARKAEPNPEQEAVILAAVDEARASHADKRRR